MEQPYSQILSEVLQVMLPSLAWPFNLEGNTSIHRSIGASKVPVDPSARQPIVGLQVFNDIKTTRNHSFPQGEEGENHVVGHMRTIIDDDIPRSPCD